MDFLRHIIGLVVALLVTALGAVAMPMMPTAAHQAEFFPLPKTVTAEHTDVHFTARAPPMAVDNVAITGATVAEYGNGIAMHGYETRVASLGFGVGLDAPNRTGSAVDGIYGNTRPMTDEFPELAGVNPHYVDGAGPGVNTNCVSCVNATVDRLTGRNPDAVAGPSNGYGVPNDLNPSAPWGFRRPTSPANVTNELLSQGDGAIAVVRIQQAGSVEHVIVGVNRGGAVHYIDPQLGAIVDLQPNLTVIPGYN